MTHKAGFVNIVGKPNVGKSTLINALTGRKVAIVSPKPQTTRQRILGIVSEEDYQIVFSDTPGILKPRYAMHRAMMRFVELAFEDADILALMVEPRDSPDDYSGILERFKKASVPAFLLINKIDLSTQTEIVVNMEGWKAFFEEEKIIPISAINGFNLQKFVEAVKDLLPESPPYYEKDLYTDRTERFLVSEVIREKIFLQYKEEIPYSTEVTVNSFKEEDTIIRIEAEIVVNKKSQKPILIGKGGLALKKTGVASRKELEDFFEKQVHLELFVKVRENWRENTTYLRGLGWETPPE